MLNVQKKAVQCGEMGGVGIMSKFIYVLTLILVVAKIFGLITLNWGLCLAPFLVYAIVKFIVYGVLLDKATKLLKEIDEGEK